MLQSSPLTSSPGRLDAQRSAADFADIPLLLDDAPVAAPAAPAAAGPAFSSDSLAKASSEDAITRVERTLSRLEELAEMLTLEDDYEPATLDFALPRTFRLSIVIPVYQRGRRPSAGSWPVWPPCRFPRK